MPLWNRFPHPTRVTRLERYLVTFLDHWEMMIPEAGRIQTRQGMIDLADSTPVRGFINTSFAAGKHWRDKPWAPIWDTHQDEFLSALLYGAIFKDVMIHHPYNWVAWRPDESDFGIVRERRECSCYGDHRLGEVMGLTYMRAPDNVNPSEPEEDTSLSTLVHTFESRRTH